MTSWAAADSPSTRRGTRHANRRGVTGRAPACKRGIGATGAGMRNILCVTGDSPVLASSPRGPHGYQRPGSDPDALDPAQDADKVINLDGREIKFPPKFFLGSCSFALCFRTQISRLCVSRKSQRRSAVLPDQPGSMILTTLEVWL